MKELTVGLQDRAYPIYIGENIEYGSLIRKALPKVQKVMVVTNETVGPLYLKSLQSSLEQEQFEVATCILKDGEKYKNIDSFYTIHTRLLEENFGRDGAIIALGGGVIGDLSGFAASTYQRGIAFVQVPTTLLAMVDSSVGGKTAINHPLGKNMIGSFHQPKAVIASLECLKTLPEREITAGLGEVVKTAMIKDEPFFMYLEKHIEAVFTCNLDVLGVIVERCCNIKAEVVAHDEKEHGLRAILNFGHTFGHALESFLGYGTWLHGEAVGLGMIIASNLAVKRGLLKAESAHRLLNLCRKAKLPVTIPENMQDKDFIFYMHHDKKVRQGTVRYVLPVDVGAVRLFPDVGDEEVSALILDLKQHP